MRFKTIKNQLPIIGIICIVISGINIYVINKQLKQNDEELYSAKVAYPEIYDHIDSVSLQSFETEVKVGELLVYVGRPDCGDCIEFEPAFLSMVKERNLEQEIVYLNVSKLRKDEYKWENFKTEYKVMYTPTVAHFKDGELISKVEWTPEEGSVLLEFETWLDEHTVS